MIYPHHEGLARTSSGDFDLEYDPAAVIEEDDGPLVFRMTVFGDGEVPHGTWCEQLTRALTAEQAEELIAGLQDMVRFMRARELARVQPLLPMLREAA